jgi:anti-sigma regulatory factor (Ser/Thr protein kinase)
MRGDRILPCEGRSAGLARSYVRETLGAWGQSQLADTAALLVSELVTNAVLHARTPLHLSLRLHPNRVRVEVGDGNPAQPAMQKPDPLSPGGRGLVLVDRLAPTWGVEERAAGKVVWFELPITVDCGSV